LNGFQKENGQSLITSALLQPHKEMRGGSRAHPDKRKRQKSILPPPTITKVWFSSYNYKTGYFTSLNFSNRPFYLPRAVLKTVCYSNRSFVFFFFKKNSVESLKNHSKSQKNHKIENPILLDST
jgi:hypothetical protein